MKPTPELRFVERLISVPVVGQPDVWTFVLRNILQQKWMAKRTIYTTYWNPELPVEWRDVPCMKESE